MRVAAQLHGHRGSENPDGSNVTAAFSVTKAGWSRDVTVNPSTHDNQLLGVDCVTSTACVSVGDYGYGPYQILVESIW